MSKKSYDVVSVCNALMDVLIEVSEADLKTLGLDKGIMQLVETPRMEAVLKHFEGRSRTVELGGSSMNVIRALTMLGHKTVFAGMVGSDDTGHTIQRRMKALGIKPHLVESEDHPTGTCLALVTKDAERTMVTHLGASRHFDETLVPREEIRAARMFHFCGYQWDTDGQKKAISEAIKEARRDKAMISFDVADPFAVGRYREEFQKLIASGVSVVFANQEEAKMLYGDPEKAAREIASHGAIAVVKLGSQGSMVRQGDKEFRVPAIKTKVVDTTAAGDMFAGGFLHGLLEGRPLEACLTMGATLAADVISRVGAALSKEALDKVKEM
jgi:sugar/nucleoside kinase (ribokinase family)